MNKKKKSETIQIKINDGWIADLKRKLTLLIENQPVKNGQIDIFDLYRNFTPVKKQVYSAKKKFIKDSHVFDIFLEQIMDLLAPYRGKENSETFSNLVGKENLKQFVNDLTDYYISIPRGYLLFFRLPQLQGVNCGTKEISRKISASEIFEKGDDKTQYFPLVSNAITRRMYNLSDLANGKTHMGLPGGYYLKVASKGYATKHLDSPVVTAGIGLIKQLLYFLYVEDKIQFEASYSGWTAEPIEGHVILFDKDRDPVLVDLPENLRVMLGKVRLKDDIKAQASVAATSGFGVINSLFGKVKPDYIFHLALKEKISAILNAEANNVNAAPLKNAAEWAFDSMMNGSDIKLSLFQISVALEAVLGVNSENKNKTLQLANRCAYLIGFSVKDRQQLIESFQEFYRVRSSLIHTGIPDEDSQKWLWWAQDTFLRIVRRELFLSKFD